MKQLWYLYMKIKHGHTLRPALTLTRPVAVGAAGLTVLLSGVSAPAQQTSPAARRTATMVWDSSADFDTCLRNRHLDSLTVPGAVQLVPRVLVADEMGAGYNNFQPVRGKLVARKIVVLDNPGTGTAQLIVDGTVAKCDISINGQVLSSSPLTRSYWDANFERYAVPGGMLRRGSNEILFRARTGGQGSIRVERSQAPNRSAVSPDGGVTWEWDRLGEGGSINGEFAVRLRLERYAPEAWLASPIVDLMQGTANGGVAAGREPRVDELAVDAAAPAGTEVQLLARTGATPDGYEENWEAWLPWEQARRRPWQRFMQWRLVLTTTKPGLTPQVRRVALRYSALPAPGSYRVLKDENQKIIRGSYPFTFAAYGGKARVLREQWKLNEVVAAGASEYEKLQALRQWVRDQWHDGWNKGALEYIPSWDPRIILTLASKNLSLGMCTHYATTFVQCAQALGFPARSTFHGHALSEVWSNDFGKWIIMDAGYDTNDRRRATYTLTRQGIPLNNLEATRAVYELNDWNEIKIEATNMSAGTEKPEPPLAGTAAEREKMLKDLPIEGRRQVFVELRNNFMDQREPEEPEHGEGYMKYLGHLFWKSKTTPDIPWTDFFTTREADINWSVNQAQIHLLAEGNRLQLLLETLTPQFTNYEVRVDEGDWTVLATTPGTPLPNLQVVAAYPGPATGGVTQLSWAPSPGRHVVEVRPVNAAGRRGLISRLTVQREEG